MSNENDPSAPGNNPLVEYDHEPTFFIEISDEDLRQVLDEHREWGNSGGKQGRRANLERVNLVGADLHGVNLTEANLHQANLSKANLVGASLAKANLQGALLGGANLQKASLWECDLQGARLSLANFQEANLTQANLFRANLRESNLQKANLTRANLREARLSLSNLQGAILGRADLQDARLHHAVLYEANLQEANLKGIKGLQIKQLRGANMSSAELPEGIEDSDWLKHVEETSRKASRLFLVKLVSCFYAWLVVASTQDVHLITNKAVSPLPLIGTQIPIASFYWIVPVVLLVLFVYFHLYLQRLWEDLAAFPAVFPDGKPLDKKVYPWLMNGLVRAHVPHLRDAHLPFFGLQRVVTIAVAWCIVPVCIAYFGVGYLLKHDPLGTAYHMALFMGSVGISLSFYLNAVATLRGQRRRPFLWSEWRSDTRFRNAFRIGLVAVVVWGGIFYGPFSLPRVNLAAADLKGADLKGANLEGGTMDAVDLRSVRLSHANLDDATLFSALLDNADLSNAYLRNTDLKGATMKGTNLTGAHLEGADLRGAQLQGANMTGASLRGANLARAAMTGIIGLSRDQLCQAETMINADLDAEMVGQITTACVEVLMGPQNQLPAGN